MVVLLFTGYLDGIRENFELVKRYYPDYTMRLYADLGGPVGAVNSDSMAKSALCDLACKEPNFDICDIFFEVSVLFKAKIHSRTVGNSIQYIS